MSVLVIYYLFNQIWNGCCGKKHSDVTTINSWSTNRSNGLIKYRVYKENV